MKQLYRSLKQSLGAFRKKESGLALIEFSFSITALIFLFIGGVELSRYVLIIQKLEKSVSEVADVVTQTNSSIGPIQDANMQQITSALPFMMNPYYTSGLYNSSTAGLSLIIVTDVSRQANNGTTCTDANPCYSVNWQYCGGMNASGSIAANPSRIAPSGAPAQHTTGTPTDITHDQANPNSPLNGFSFAAGEEIIVAEYFYNFKPILLETLVPTSLVYRYAIFSPRLGSLATPPTGSSSSQCS